MTQEASPALVPTTQIPKGWPEPKHGPTFAFLTSKEKKVLPATVPCSPGVLQAEAGGGRPGELSFQ